MVLESQSQLGDFPSSLTVKAKYAVWLCKFRNIFKLSALPNVSQKKKNYFLSIACQKMSPPLNIFSHIWLHVHDFFSSKKK